MSDLFKMRRFKALNGAKGEYSRIVEKIAIYNEQGTQIDCCVIHQDKEGREYYYPSNPNEKFGLFSGRPKDAIECIINGFGDALECTQIVGMNIEHVVRFIDREYGENIRQKTIEGWKDAKFAYAVKFYFLNSFGNGRLICKNKTLMSWFNNSQDEILTFETESEASDFIEEVNEKAKEYYNEYTNLERTDDKNYNYEKICKPFFDKIEGKIENGIDSVYWMAFAHFNDKDNGKPSYNMKVVQVVLH